MSGYSWSVSAGGEITAGGSATDNSVTITWNTTGAQNVSVNYVTGDGCTAAAATSFGVTVDEVPVPTISGPESVCANSTGNVYFTEAGMTAYSWTVSAGGTITGRGTPTSDFVLVTWGAAGTQAVNFFLSSPN